MTSSLIGTDKRSAALLDEAVHRNGLLSIDGLLERLFTLSFRELVYPLIWEDAAVDLAAMEVTPQTRIITIASGGCNVLNYLCANPAEILAVDLNRAHVALNTLKLTALDRLSSHADFQQLFGRASGTQCIETYWRGLSPHLDAETRGYWEGRDRLGRMRIDRFRRGLYKQGLLGRFIGLAHGIGWIYGTSPRCMMRARTRAEQCTIFGTELAPLFDKRLVRMILSHRAALYGLGIPPAQYDALIGDAAHMADVVRDRLRKLACDFDLQDNYFAWAAFNRGFASDGLGPQPPYLDAANFSALKCRAGRVSISLVSMTEKLAQQEAASLDRYVLLDAQDWMGDDDLTRLWTQITRTARADARVIFRTAGRDTILPGRVPASLLDRWHYAEARSRELTAQDRSAIYGGFHLYTLRPAD